MVEQCGPVAISGILWGAAPTYSKLLVWLNPASWNAPHALAFRACPGGTGAFAHEGLRTRLPGVEQQLLTFISDSIKQRPALGRGHALLHNAGRTRTGAAPGLGHKDPITCRRESALFGTPGRIEYRDRSCAALPAHDFRSRPRPRNLTYSRITRPPGYCSNPGRESNPTTSRNPRTLPLSYRGIATATRAG